MRKFRLTTTSRVARARRFYAWGPSLSGDADEYNLQTHASRKPTNSHLTSLNIVTAHRVSLKFWFCSSVFFMDIQCNSRRYNSMQSLHVALSITRFLEFTATGTGSGWQSDRIQQYFICIFDATVWILCPLR